MTQRFLRLLAGTLVLASPSLTPAQLPQRPPVPVHLPVESLREAASRIDEAALQTDREQWKRLNEREIPSQRKPYALPETVADDVFIRRLYVDLQARHPEPDVVRQFLLSTVPQKRSAAVDKALDHPLAAARRFLRLADMLRVKDTVLGASMHSYVEWLRQAVANDVPYNLLVQQLITSTGDLAKAPASGFLMTDAGQMTVTLQEMMRVFLDENLQCASCHDHPFADATQMQVYRMAAVLTQVEMVKAGPRGQVRLWPASVNSPPAGGDIVSGEELLLIPSRQPLSLLLPRDYLYRDGKPGDPVKPGLPTWITSGWGQMHSMASNGARAVQPCAELASWIVKSERFAEVAALRTWNELFGSFAPNAMDESTDSKADTHSPDAVLRAGSCEGVVPRSISGSYDGHFTSFRDKGTDPSLRLFARTLGVELARVKYDLREFERILCHTQAYQRHAQILRLGWPSRFIAPVFRRQTADAIWNNLVLVQTDGTPAGKMLMSQELPQVPGVDHPIRLLGRSNRAWGDDSLRNITHNLVVTLGLGDSTRRASAFDGPLVRRLASIQPGDLAVEEAFLMVLGRLPTLEEKMAALNHGVQNPGTVWSDVVWSLLNTSEFVFQY